MRLGNQLSQGDIYFPDASGKPIVTGGIQGDISYMPYAKLQGGGCRKAVLGVWPYSSGKPVSSLVVRKTIFPRCVSETNYHWYFPEASRTVVVTAGWRIPYCGQVPTPPARVGYNMYEHAVTKCPHYQHALLTVHTVARCSHPQQKLFTNTLWPSAHTTNTLSLLNQHALLTEPTRTPYSLLWPGAHTPSKSCLLYEQAEAKCPHNQHALLTEPTRTPYSLLWPGAHIPSTRCLLCNCTNTLWAKSPHL